MTIFIHFEVNYNSDLFVKNIDDNNLYHKYLFCFFLGKCLELLNEKDNVINKLVDGLEELLSNCLIETEANSDDLIKLNKITKTKVKTLKEEHDKYQLFITVSLEM